MGFCILCFPCCFNLYLIFFKAKDLLSDVLKHSSSPPVLVLPWVLTLITKQEATGIHPLYLERFPLSSFYYSSLFKNPEYPTSSQAKGHFRCIIIIIIMSRSIPTADHSAFCHPMPLTSKELNPRSSSFKALLQVQSLCGGGPEGEVRAHR